MNPDKIEARIEAAKRAQVRRKGGLSTPGGQKRCRRGKSCGATCISQYKICLVDIPLAPESSIPKVVKDIEDHKKYSRDDAASPKDTKPASRPTLSPLNTELEFEKKLSDTEGEYSPEIIKMHYALRKILGPLIGKESFYKDSEEEKEYRELRNKLLKYLSKGDEAKGAALAKFAQESIEAFTQAMYSEIRGAQMGTEPDEGMLRKAKAIEKLLSSPAAKKPPVEKFRGLRVNNSTLLGMVRSAKAGKTFSGGALASWSTDMGIAKEFADKNTEAPLIHGVILRTINSRGEPIKALSGHNREHEVLTSGSAEYKYLSHRVIRYHDMDYHIFDVEES